MCQQQQLGVTKSNDANDDEECVNGLSVLLHTVKNLKKTLALALVRVSELYQLRNTRLRLKEEEEEEEELVQRNS